MFKSGTHINSDHAPEYPAFDAIRHIGTMNPTIQMTMISQCQMLKDPKALLLLTCAITGGWSAQRVSRPVD